MSKIFKSTPLKDGFRMPGEFEQHSSTWMLWPERPDIWRLGGKPAQKLFSNIANTISKFEPVSVGVSPREYMHARSLLNSDIRVVEMSFDDVWIRDCGPIGVVNVVTAEIRCVDWEFNAWGGLNGGLYFPWDKDNLVARKVAEIERLDMYRVSMILEGGSIHVDGDGTLITTEECLLNPNRNPKLTKTEIEETLKSFLGIENIIWLKKGVYFDEAGGHIDNLCCFVKPGVIALTWTDDQKDPQYEISYDAYEILVNSKDTKGRFFKVEKIHQPKPTFITEEESADLDQIEGSYPRLPGDRLAASYINYYVCNGGVIVPIFNDPQDQLALEKVQALYPDREVVGMPAREILLGGGNIHCITQQIPKVI